MTWASSLPASRRPVWRSWGGPESHENGKFAWIVDPDGNKVELWEPMLWDEKNKEG